MAQAADVCLARHHQSPVEFTINDNVDTMQAQLSWSEPDDRTRAAWGDQNDVIEDGGTALALAAVELRLGLVAHFRARRASGADYYVSPLDTPSPAPGDTMRLELSAIDNDQPGQLRRRVREKLQQLARGNEDTPGVAAVVGFRGRTILLQKQETP